MRDTRSSTPDLYLDLLKGCLSRALFIDEEVSVVAPASRLMRALQALVRRSLDVELVRRNPKVRQLRSEGRDWPPHAETMIGIRRLDHIQACITDVIRNQVPGDLIETGVWRGGATILMRAVLKAYGDTERTVWVADSFRGLPKPDGRAYAADEGDQHWTKSELAVTVDTVKENFERYGLLDEQVRFLPGWFKDTLPNAPITTLAVMRLDGDMYESTIQALESLYPKLSVGGHVIVDDYGAIPACRAAVDDFRQRFNITEGMHWVDWTGVSWKRVR
jgi:O-methyltransferase